MSVSRSRPAPHLEHLAAKRAAELIKGVPTGSSFEISSGDDLCDILELLVPEVLRHRYPQWRRESIDGFFFSLASKTGAASADLGGTCILMQDQTVTPFVLSLRLSSRGGLDTLRVRLGEAGGGLLGISGPACNSRAAETLLTGLADRMDRVTWVYDATAKSSR